MGRLDPEKVRTRAAPRQLIGRRGPYILNLHVQANRNPGQRMVSVEHHVLGINVGHSKKGVARRSTGSHFFRIEPPHVQGDGGSSLH